MTIKPHHQSDRLVIARESIRASDLGGFAWYAAMPRSIPDGDSMEQPVASGLLLYENGVEIGPARSLHDDIARNGGGAFSHWGVGLTFSTADNSDPRSNGRIYAVTYDHDLHRRLRSAIKFQLTTDPAEPTNMFRISLGRILTHAGDVEMVCEEIRTLAITALSEEQRFFLAERLAHAAYPKYKFSAYGRLILEDEDFLAYYAGIMDPGNWHSFDRKYTLNQFLKLVQHIEGDVAECGVYKGASAHLMCRALQGRSNLVHLFDSFEGLSAPLQIDGGHWKSGSLSAGEDALASILGPFDNYRVYKGWIPERFPDVAELKFRFVHIDVDLYEPTRDSLAFFYPRLAPGGIVLLDDHGSGNCPGAKKAAEEFFADKPEQIAMLSTGQAFTIKQ